MMAKNESRGSYRIEITFDKAAALVFQSQQIFWSYEEAAAYAKEHGIAEVIHSAEREQVGVFIEAAIVNRCDGFREEIS